MIPRVFSILLLAWTLAELSPCLVAKQPGDVDSLVFEGTLTNYPAGHPLEPGLLFSDGPYKDAWNTPVSFPVLNLDLSAGGLVPLEAGGGYQTKTLKLRGNNGLVYKFRPLRKTHSLLKKISSENVHRFLFQDSSILSFPYSPGIFSALLDALEVVEHAHSRLCVLPNSPLLLNFRKNFAGLPGYLGFHFPTKPPLDSRFPFGALQILKTSYLLEENSKYGNRINRKRYLLLRFLDVLTGDWDRHQGQWRWLRNDENGPWIPVTLDHDMAFSNFRGTLLDSFLQISRPYASHIREPFFLLHNITSIDNRIRELHSLTYLSHSMDTRILKALPRSEWNQVLDILLRAITTRSLDAILESIPDPVRARYAPSLKKILLDRLKNLSKFSDAYFQYIRTGDERVLFKPSLQINENDAP